MLGNGGVYAVKRRKKPVQKNVKPPPVKTNPSKRHRDRLNAELDRLTSLLNFPEDIKSRLDKLSVLRLSVGYLKIKSYFHAAVQKNACLAPSNGRNVSLDGVSFSEGELLLRALNGFVLVVTSDGTVLYASPTVQEFLGFRQSDVVYQSVYDLIHMDDRDLFKCQLHFALNPNETTSDVQPNPKSTSFLPQYIPPENSSFLERNFCCRVRCLLDNTSGFLALHFNGRLKYLHMQGNARADGNVAHPELALLAIATAVQPPSVMEIRAKSLIFQTKHRMDFAPVGIDTRGKLVLGYSEMELVTVGSGYQFLHAADMMYCADNHLKMIKTGDSGFTFFRLLTKMGHWLWVQASARVVFKGERPDFIIARQKALTHEEGEEHLRQRRQQLPFNIATGEGVLYDISLDAFSLPGPPGSTAEKPVDPGSMLGSLRQQDHSIYTRPQQSSPQLPNFTQIEHAPFEQPQQSFEQAFLDSHAVLNVPGQSQTSQNTSCVEDLTSEALIESLEQILVDIGDGWAQDFEVEATELRDWENTLIKMNRERGDALEELNHILPNDVFSYVEEALRRETGGYVHGSSQTGSHSAETIHSLSDQAQCPGSVQGMTDIKSNHSGIEERTGLKGVSAGVSQRVAHTPTPTQYANTHKGQTSLLWPSSSNTYHCDNQMVSAQSCRPVHPQPEVSHQTWFPCAQNTNRFHSSHLYGLEEMNQSVHHPLNHTQTGLVKGQSLQHTSMEPRGQDASPAWKQLQQLPQSFHNHTLTHSSHTSTSVNPVAQSFHHSSQMQRLSGSCKYARREGHIPKSATVSTSQNELLLGPQRSGGSTHATKTTTNTPFIMPHSGVATAVEGVWLTGPNEGTTQVAPCANVGNIRVGDLGGDSSGLNSAGSEYPANHYALDSSVGMMNQRSVMNDVVNPFVFSAFPNLSQNSGQ